jgi:formylglycine-generating enzyme required for sulfatase activity
MSCSCPWCGGELPGAPGEFVKCRHCGSDIFWGAGRPHRSQLAANNAGIHSSSIKPKSATSPIPEAPKADGPSQGTIDAKIKQLLLEQKEFVDDPGRLGFFDRCLLLLVRCCCWRSDNATIVDRFLTVRGIIYLTWKRIKRIPAFLLWLMFAVLAAIVVFFAGVSTPQAVQPHLATALNKVTVLTEAAAKELAKFEGEELDLSGLKSIDDSVAAELAKWPGVAIKLAGLESIDSEVAKDLAAWKGKTLDLSGLDSIDSEVAKELATWKGKTLDLSGLEELSQVGAQALARWRGELLRLAGVKSMADDVARELAKAQAASLDLVGLVSVGEETFAILKVNPRIALPATQPSVAGGSERVPAIRDALPAAVAMESITNSIGIKLNKIPAGTFTMGEGDNAHKVTLTQPFYLGVTEVTNAQWKAVMGNVPSTWKDDDCPVEQVSWDDVVSFCKKLSSLPAERAAGRVYRLPTEAEWEYACRSSSSTSYSFGDDESLLGDFAWFSENAGKQTHAVGQKRPNAWGLYDMHGNVWEWCSDRYGDYPDGAVSDPQGPSSGSVRVIRGGSWFRSAGLCRSAIRGRDGPSYRGNGLGFRLALSPSGSQPPEADVTSERKPGGSPSERATAAAGGIMETNVEPTPEKKPVDPRLGSKPQSRPDLQKLSSNLMAFRNQVGKSIDGMLTGRSRGALWGTAFYTLDSDPGTAAVHAGVLKDGETAAVRLTIKPGQASYKGSTANGVRSNPWGSYPGSFTIERLGVLPAEKKPVESPKPVALDGSGKVPTARDVPTAAVAMESITNSIGIKLNKIPAGTFTMGEGDNAHKVTLTQPFYLGVTEVTNAQWKAVMGNVPSTWKDDDCPVEQVSWEEAVSFCEKLSSLSAERAAGRVYRLPTEAEWEYTCRAGTTTSYSFGNDELLLGDFAWFDGNAGSGTHAVGQKRPNAWGLYDMHGNVWEWCSDWFGDYPGNAVSDPQGVASGSRRVRRGGGWHSSAEICRSADRHRSGPSNPGNDVGFRLALSPSGSKSDTPSNPALSGKLIRKDAQSMLNIRFGNDGQKSIRYVGGLAQKRLSGLVVDKDGLWTAVGSGLLRWSTQPDRWDYYQRAESPDEDYVTHIAKVGQYIAIHMNQMTRPGYAKTLGTFLFDPETLQWRKLPLLYSYEILGEGTKLWQVGGDAVSVFDINTNIETKLPRGFKHPSVAAVDMDEAEIWIAMHGKYVRGQGENFNGGGVSVFDRKLRRWRNFGKEAGLARGYCCDIAIDPKRVWTVHWDPPKGISWYDRSTGKWQSRAKSENGILLGGTRIHSLHGKVWINQHSGLVIYDPNTGIAEQMSSKDGLIGRSFSSVAADKSGVWLTAETEPNVSGLKYLPNDN